MRTIIDYMIVQADGQFELAESVIERIKAGWQPIGGVSIRHGSSYGALYMQAMVMYDGNDNNLLDKG